MRSLVDRLMTEESEHTLSVRNSVYEKVVSGDALVSGSRGMMSSILGVGMSGNTAKAQYAAIREWSFVCIKAIAQRAAGQRIHVGLLDSTSNVLDDRAAGRLSKGLPMSLKKDARNIEVLDQHQIINSIERPNRAMTKWQLIYNLISSILATGKAYWLILPREDGEDGLSIWPLPAHWVTPIHKDGLFSAYRVQPEGSFNTEIVNGNQMAYFSFPDPSDPLKATSTLATQSRAIRVDEQIQKAQEKMLENGIFPKVLLRAGRLPGMEMGDRGGRPTLSMAQRKQLQAVINRLYKDTTNAGAPMIIDGVIEGVEKFSQTAQEMDFLDSGEAVKKRIFQAFGVPPQVVGEKTPGSYAQATVVNQGFLDNVVNPLLDMVSQALTSWLGPMFDEDSKTVVWIEPAVAEDREWNRKVWDQARLRGDVTDDEFRAEMLGLPPNEDLARENRKPVFLKTPASMGQVAGLMEKANAGTISELGAARLLSSFANFTVDEALMVISGAPGDFDPQLLLTSE